MSSELKPVDGVVYHGENAAEVCNWLTDHGYSWSYNSSTRVIVAGSGAGLEVYPTSLIEATEHGLRVERAEHVEWQPRPTAPIHLMRNPAEGTLCGRPLLDALTGDPLLTVGSGFPHKVSCDECLKRLAPERQQVAVERRASAESLADTVGGPGVGLEAMYAAAVSELERSLAERGLRPVRSPEVTVRIEASTEDDERSEHA